MAQPEKDTGFRKFIDDNYPEYLEFLCTNFSNTGVKHSDDFYDIFLLRLIPKIKSVKDKKENFRLIKDELLFHFTKEQLTDTPKIQAFADNFYDFNYQLNRDIKSESLNRISKIIGLFLMLADVTFILLITAFPNGYSLGIYSYLLGLAICSIPAVPGLIALLKKGDTYFGNVHYLLLAINLSLNILLLYLIWHYVHYEI
jgi:hypothetical protein